MNELEIRKVHGEEQLEILDPVGKKKDELLNWLNKHDITSSINISDFSAVLESVEENG